MFTRAFCKSSGITPAITGTALFALGMLATGSAVQANMLINLNLSASLSTVPTGTPAALVEGQMQWNNLDIGSSTTLSNLIDTSGNATAIGVAVAGASGGYNSSASTVSQVNPMLYTYPANGGSPTVTFSGLDATGTTTYDLYVYNWWDWNPGGTNTTTSITEAGGTLPAAQTSHYTDSASTEGNTFTQGVNYALFTGLTANASGDIQVSSTGAAEFNGLQLVAVSTPEPATLALLAAAAMGLLLLRRRKTA